MKTLFDGNCGWENVKAGIAEGLCRRFAWVFVGLAGGVAGTLAAPEREAHVLTSFPVTIRVNATNVVGELRPVWRYFGYDEPNYTYLPNGRKLLSQLAALSPAPVYVRTHNLLTSGDGTPALKWGSTGVYSEEPDGTPRYDWTLVDRIFDTYLERGMKPLAQLGFMPEALSIRPQPYRHHWQPGAKYNDIYTGWAYPPKDYRKWGELVYQWARHCVERYGAPEVASWWWEAWNEPNIGYWRGTAEEYFKLYDFAAEAVKRALPAARVGGPHSTGPRSEGAARFLKNFLEHCLRGTNYATGKTGAPLDYVGFHAKGAPAFVDGHVRMGLAAQLQDIQRGFEIVAGYPELRGKPIIIGESDPDGCAACSARVYPQYGYRDGALYASYTAASFARKYALAEEHGVNFEGAVTWAFEFEDQPWFVGFRSLASNGIEKPVLNVFRMLGRMEGRRVAVESYGDAGVRAMVRHGVRGAPDVAALASRGERRLSMLLWHYHDDDVPGAAAAVQLEVQGLPAERSVAKVRHFRVDDEHSNAFTAWKRLGSPPAPTAEQRARLEAAAALALLPEPADLRLTKGQGTLHVTLPRQSVSLLLAEW